MIIVVIVIINKINIGTCRNAVIEKIDVRTTFNINILLLFAQINGTDSFILLYNITYIKSYLIVNFRDVYNDLHLVERTNKIKNITAQKQAQRKQYVALLSHPNPKKQPKKGVMQLNTNITHT